MMKPVRINLRERSGFKRVKEPVQLGIPFREGELFSHSAVTLRSAQGHFAPVFQTTPLGFWPDGSIRWLKLSFSADLDPGQAASFDLTPTNGPQEVAPSPLTSELMGDYWHIQTGKTSFCLPRNELRWFASRPARAEITHEICLTDRNNRLCLATPDMEWQRTESGPAQITLTTRGKWQTSEGFALARFECHLHFYPNIETAKLDICVHNPRRARHPGGLWDLGDSGSVHFRELAVHIEVPDSTTAWIKPEADQSELRSDEPYGLKLYQGSSGGEHWHSRNHLNAAGEIITHFRGYQLQVGNEVRLSGNRATPVIGLEGTGKGASIQASLQQFWQNFPSSLSAAPGKVKIGLFPSDAAGLYELQGGERKTQTAYLNYSSDRIALLWTQTPITPTLDATQYERANAFPWFHAKAQKSVLDELIQRGIDGPRNFFAKREAIDEFGWRNFGDLFADHETLYQDLGDSPLISHYNNQYDAIYGFARQFALTGDSRWFDLMNDLAGHVTDIDIYHTEEDRAEYNNGLFWHTDHYLDAHTATHRTFTRHNATSSTPGQTGGGPAAEHCYTTGLLYHYYLTGSESSRQAVIDLAGWMTRLHEGQGGLLEQMLALKKNELPKLKALLKKEKPTTHSYPFTRGTGNYLTALIDAYMLDGNPFWLKKAESVIAETIHPLDDITRRNLLNVETGWSYLILLASVARYIELKQQLCAPDTALEYAKKSFLHYAEWMKENERPFLSDPTKLEFPNDTWVAQDIRKGMLMFQAAKLDPDNAVTYIAKGNEWMDYVTGRLLKSAEAEYSRILVILLQNYGPHQLNIPKEDHYAAGREPGPGGQDKASRLPELTWLMLLSRISHRIIRGLLTFRPRREQAWLKARLDRE